MSLPVVSVLIPVYNGARFLNTAIQSVLNQTYQNFELILCDNASTDTTPEIIKSFKDIRIRYHRNARNLGLIPNWNRAFSLAQGKYIKILPADDVLYPEALNTQVKILENDLTEQIALVASGRHIINESGKVLMTRRLSHRHLNIDGTNAINRVIRSGGNGIGEGGSVLFRKSLMEQTGPFNSNIFYVLDLDQWFKFLTRGRLVYLPEVCAAFRVSSDSASVQMAEQQRRDYLQFIRLVYREKSFGLRTSNYYLGTVKTILFTQLKKLLYRFVIR